ncbi:MAG: recombinase family protein [Anaerolineales bacterium]|nr:recombinase family protein [Anaerolineales bacterium]
MHAQLYSTRPDVLDQQIETARGVLRENGWELVSIYQDVGNGLKVDHTGLQQMLHDAHQGLFDVVVVTNFDRITRSTNKLMSIISDLEAQGIGLYMDTEQFKTTTGFDLVCSLFSAHRNRVDETT